VYSFYGCCFYSSTSHISMARIQKEKRTRCAFSTCINQLISNFLVFYLRLYTRYTIISKIRHKFLLKKAKKQPRATSMTFLEVVSCTARHGERYKLRRNSKLITDSIGIVLDSILIPTGNVLVPYL
jgi:hypothetical protein